jgi:hypothetical protein
MRGQIDTATTLGDPCVHLTAVCAVRSTPRRSLGVPSVGDPFKDTSGPSLNILIKLMTVVAVIFLPWFL